MAGGWAGYCLWGRELVPGPLDPRNDGVGMLTPGCLHHSALPESPSLAPPAPAPRAPRPWWRRLGDLLPGRFGRRAAGPWQREETGVACPACGTPIFLGARGETEGGVVMVGRCGGGRRGCGAFWWWTPRESRVLAPREAEALRRHLLRS